MAAIVIGLAIAAVVLMVVGIMQWAIGQLTGIVLPTLATDWQLLGLDLDLLNSFIPLAERITYIFAVLTIILIVIVVRWVKSFIPTITN